MAENEEIIVTTDEDEEVIDGSRPAKIPRISKTKPFTNPVHSHFIPDGDYSKCKYCKKKLKGKNPTNLLSHLNSCNPTVYQKCVDDNTTIQQSKKVHKSGSSSSGIQTNILDGFRHQEEKKKSIQKGTESYKTNVRAVAIAFAGNNLPYRLIEDRFIKNMFKVVSDNRLTILPNRHELSAEIKTLTDEIRKLVEASLENAKLVSLTTDI